MRALVYIGVFLVVLAVYALSGPGRVDMIDGQYRYEVAQGLLREGRPVLRDPALPLRVPGRGGRYYAFYGPGASIAALPLVWLGNLLGDGSRELPQFLFSFTAALFGALTAVLLFCFYELLGVSRRRALGWTLAVAFASLMWPVSTSSFDQTQQAFFVLLAVYAGERSARADSTRWALVCGAATAVLVNCQEIYVALVPAIGMACAREGERWRDYWRTKRARTFLALAAVGVGGVLAYNLWRFGNPLRSGKESVGHSLVGNPVVGAFVLLFSPGKSILLYSPTVLLAVAGWRQFRARAPSLARNLALIAGLHFIIIASLSFCGGDWCWGPRYLVVTLPLVSLALPFVAAPRLLVGAVLVAGVCVQLLALSVDHQRFFFERALPDHFWSDRGFYFRHSALFARPGELASILRAELPAESRAFVPAPYRSATYAPFGNPELARTRAPVWMRQFAVFYRPRPWPLWLRTLPRQQQTFVSPALIPSLFVMLTLGAAAIVTGASIVRRDVADA